MWKVCHWQPWPLGGAPSPVLRGTLKVCDSQIVGAWLSPAASCGFWGWLRSVWCSGRFAFDVVLVIGPSKVPPFRIRAGVVNRLVCVSAVVSSEPAGKLPASSRSRRGAGVMDRWRSLSLIVFSIFTTCAITPDCCLIVVVVTEVVS